MFDELDNAELAEVKQVQDFVDINFRLIDIGELQISGLQNTVHREHLGTGLSGSLSSGVKDDTTSASGEPIPPGEELIRKAETAERQRLKGKKKRKVADTEAGKAVQSQTPFGDHFRDRATVHSERWVASAAWQSLEPYALSAICGPRARRTEQVTDPRPAGFPQFFVYLRSPQKSRIQRVRLRRPTE